MPDSVQTVQIQNWVKRIQAGDRVAREELLRAVVGRLEIRVQQMLSGFRVVKRWAETGDVLQSALLRLLRALEQVEITSTRDFFGLAATQIRRELIDLARQYNGPLHQAAHHESTGDQNSFDAVDSTPGDLDLQQWASFHEEVEKLPAEEREVVSLVFYHDWTQAQVAEMFGVHLRTVRRWWLSAIVKLSKALRYELLGISTKSTA